MNPICHATHPATHSRAAHPLKFGVPCCERGQACSLGLLLLCVPSDFCSVGQLWCRGRGDASSGPTHGSHARTARGCCLFLLLFFLPPFTCAVVCVPVCVCPCLCVCCCWLCDVSCSCCRCCLSNSRSMCAASRPRSPLPLPLPPPSSPPQFSRAVSYTPLSCALQLRAGGRG